MFVALAFGVGFIIAIGLIELKKKFLPKKSAEKSGKLAQPMVLQNTLPTPPKENVLPTPYQFGSLQTLSPRMQQIYKAAKIISATRSTILISGESGTGKEALAKEIHVQGMGQERPFVAVNCAALSANLLESELFGHERGAFTGAIEQRIGRFEQANGGTLFLDEIGDLPLDLQVKLLRVLQERSIERLGSNKLIPVNVRVMAATHQDLDGLIEQNKFREDLFYRLNVVQIRLLPLRERLEDLPLLLDQLILSYAKQFGKNITSYHPNVLHKLRNYTFPGNIRELQNILEQAILFAAHEELNQNDIQWHARNTSSAALGQQSRETSLSFKKQVDYAQIMRIYHQTQGNKSAAARLLGMKESTYRYQLKKAFEERLIYADRKNHFDH